MAETLPSTCFSYDPHYIMQVFFINFFLIISPFFSRFNIIKNELHNIMRSQLKRVDGEVSAMSQRIKALDENLAKSEQYIKTATQP